MKQIEVIIVGLLLIMATAFSISSAETENNICAVTQTANGEYGKLKRNAKDYDEDTPGDATV